MSTIKVKDGTEIYYKDWGTGQPIVFTTAGPYPQTTGIAHLLSGLSTWHAYHTGRNYQ